MLGKWCQMSHCDGIADLYDSRTSRKQFVFWSIVVAIMFGLGVVFTYRTIEGYVETPVVTNVALHRDSKMVLPQVLICYNGGVSVAAIKRARFSDQFAETLTAAILDPDSNANSNESVRLMEYLKRTNCTLAKFIQRVGFKCQDLVRSIHRAEMTEDEGCELAKGVIMENGNCYIFDNLTDQWWPGVWGGAMLKLKAPKDSFASMFPSKALAIGAIKSFEIFLEKSFDVYGPGRFITAPINTKVEIILNTKRYKRSSGCEDGIELTTSNSCFYRCWLVEVTRACNCSVLNYIPHEQVETYRMCDIFQSCNRTSTAVRTQECNAKCKPMCDEWIFESSVAYATYDPSTWDEDQTDVLIGYSSMQYTQVEIVAAFTIDMAIANVGGQAGLWLGISVTSIIQLFYYIVMGIYERFSKK